MADPIKQTCPCPKCNRTLIQSGTMIVQLDPDDDDGESVELPTFQCDECLVNVDFAGEQMELALTFCRRADGTLFDPASPDGEVRF